MWGTRESGGADGHAFGGVGGGERWSRREGVERHRGLYSGCRLKRCERARDERCSKHSEAAKVHMCGLLIGLTYVACRVTVGRVNGAGFPPHLTCKDAEDDAYLCSNRYRV